MLMVRVEAAGLYYVREQEKTRTTFLGNGWINTGDIFTQDENDYFWYAGRANEMIKVSGVWVSPLEIEQSLQDCAVVKECAVMGIGDKDGLIKIKAFVVPREDAKDSAAMLDELKEFCKRKLAPHKFPRSIEFIRELPKTGSGKIDRGLLRKRVLQ